MRRYVIRRMLIAPLLLLIVTMVTYSAAVLAGGDPAKDIAGSMNLEEINSLHSDAESQQRAYEQYQAIRKELGTDQPIVIQYLMWLGIFPKTITDEAFDATFLLEGESSTTIGYLESKIEGNAGNLISATIQDTNNDTFVLEETHAITDVSFDGVFPTLELWHTMVSDSGNNVTVVSINSTTNFQVVEDVVFPNVGEVLAIDVGETTSLQWNPNDPDSPNNETLNYISVSYKVSASETKEIILDSGTGITESFIFADSRDLKVKLSASTLARVELDSVSKGKISPINNAKALFGTRALEVVGVDGGEHLQFKGIIQGNFGVNWKAAGKPDVLEEILNYLPATLQLTATAMIFAILTGLSVGIMSAVKHNTTTDRLLVFITLTLYATPGYWLGLIMIRAVSVDMYWLHGGAIPVYGMRAPLALLLPAVAMGIASAGGYARITRSSMLEVIRQDYIMTARSKGLAEKLVIYRHALRNALIPVVTVIGLSLVGLFSGALIIESIFAWPGMGRYGWFALQARIYPVIMGIVVISSLLLVVMNLIVDIAYAYLDPRIAY